MRGKQATVVAAATGIVAVLLHTGPAHAAVAVRDARCSTTGAQGWMVAEIYSGYVTGHTNAKDTLGDGHHARARFVVATTAGHYYGDWVKATGGKGDWQDAYDTVAYNGRVTGIAIQAARFEKNSMFNDCVIYDYN
ncbi:hypothetical protein [Streptomyces mesophilus]|uniref:hypothetical protein n=1 Tax=Streptomyces mesophilus TaxID=1775132 RepID=UPI003328510B